MVEQKQMMLIRFVIMHNFLEYSSHYSDTSGSLQFYVKDEATKFNANIEDDNNFKFSKYQAKLLGNTKADDVNGILKNTVFVAPLKYLSNF